MDNDGLAGEERKRSTWAIVMGVLIVLLGLLLVTFPFPAGVLAAVVLGWVLMLVGIAEAVFAFHAHRKGRLFLRALSALLFLILGAGLAFFPVAGLAIVTGVLGTFLIVEAVTLVATAFHVRPEQGWGWFLFDAFFSTILGLMILAHWPHSARWAVGTLVGVAVLFSGFSRIMIGSNVRGRSTPMQHLRKSA